MSGRFKSVFENFWFPAWPAARLGVLRVLLGLYVLQDLVRVRRAAHTLSDGDPLLWDPVGVTTLLAGPLAPAQWHTVYDATIGLCLLFILGAGWRVIGPLFAGFLLFSWTYRVSWQMIYHVHHLTMLHVLVVAAAPAAAAVSVDAWWGSRRGRPAPAPSWRFGWPVRLVCVVTAILYCLAGVAKVQLAGWGWADGHNLLDQIAYDGLYKGLLGRDDRDMPSPLIAYAFSYAWLLGPAATGSLMVELGAPIALLHRRIGYAWSLAAIGMHWGIHLFMNLVFPYPISGMAFLSFFPLEKLLPARWRGDTTEAASG
ncbi:MAG: hypothetical protein V4850_01065 [Myxococcota bacterium]